MIKNIPEALFENPSMPKLASKQVALSDNMYGDSSVEEHTVLLVIDNTDIKNLSATILSAINSAIDTESAVTVAEDVAWLAPQTEAFKSKLLQMQPNFIFCSLTVPYWKLSSSKIASSIFNGLYIELLPDNKLLLSGDLSSLEDADLLAFSYMLRTNGPRIDVASGEGLAPSADTETALELFQNKKSLSESMYSRLLEDYKHGLWLAAHTAKKAETTDTNFFLVPFANEERDSADSSHDSRTTLRKLVTALGTELKSVNTATEKAMIYPDERVFNKDTMPGILQATGVNSFNILTVGL